MRKVLSPKFFKGETTGVARALLGKILVRKEGKKTTRTRILETEAYDGLRDKASHAFKGKTERTKHMFGPPGVWYVYFTYGMHWMLNVTTREEGYPAAVLIRGTDLAKGPGRLTKSLNITGKLNGKAAIPKNGLWIEDDGFLLASKDIKSGSRIGVTYAGKFWAGRKWRFWTELKD